MSSNSILNIKKDGEWSEIPCLKGEDGFSPTATVEKVGKVATITITDINGTTTATVADGTSSGGSGEENTIESISVNGSPISIDEHKNVDITVPSIDGLTKDADLATVAKSGDYEDLINKPTIPDITGLATEIYVDNKVADYTKTVDLADVAISGSYNDLADKPTVPSLDGYAKTSEIPSKVSELENDSNYLSSIPKEYVTDAELESKGYLTEHQDISGKVDKVDGKSLISDTEIERLASVDNYNDTDIKAEIAKKADTTAIPSKVSELTNDSNYQTAEQVSSTVTTEIAKVVADAPEDFDTLKEMSDWISGHKDDASAMNSAISDNKTAITALQSGKADKSEIPTTVAELTDSADYAKTADIPEALPANGGNADTVNNHTIKSDVPENAKFTDTVYDDTEVKGSINELNSNLDRLEYSEVTGGKNKFDFGNKYGYEDKYQLIKSVSDKSLSMKTRDYGATIVYRNKKLENLGETSISFSSTSTGGTNARLCFKLFDANGDILTSSNCNFPIGEYNEFYDGWYYDFSSFGDLSITFTMPTNVAFWKLGLAANAEAGYTVTFTNIQVEQGSTATSYKPYIPSVKMLADEVSAQNESLSVIGKCKNLLKPTLQTTTQNGVTCTNNGDGTYTFNGTATTHTWFTLGKAKLYSGKTYRLCGLNKVGNSTLYIQLRNDNIIMQTTNNGIDVSITETSENYLVVAFIPENVTYNNVIYKPMITEDLTATYDDFVPYTGDGETLTHDVAQLNKSLADLEKRCINVLEHGIVGDGVTDNYDAIQNLINNADEGSTIFFPKGVYCISKGLVTSSKNINIVGERKGRYIANNDQPSAKFGSIIKYIGTENATMLTQGASDWYLTMSNITFYSDSCKFKDNGLADGTIPYLQYALELSDKVVNGIECIHGCQLRNVAVVGMSGYGIKPSQTQSIIECDIYSCRYGILQENNDLMIRNCYISASGTAIYCKGSKNLIASDCYMDLLTEYGIYCENYLSGNITDCYIDHSNYSAVCVKGASNNLNLDIYCGRNGIYYSGAAEEDIKNSTAATELSNMAMATAVCFNFMIESNIKIHAVKRPNDDAGTSAKKTPVFTLYIQQIKSGYIEGTQINEYIRQKANTVRPVIVNANGIIKSIYKSNEYTKAGVVKKTYTPQSNHMASQIGDMWIYGNKVYIATNITDTETTWTPITA